MQRVAFPSIQPGVPQDLQVTFNNRQYYFPFYNINSAMSANAIQRLRQVTVGLSMVRDVLPW